MSPAVLYINFVMTILSSRGIKSFQILLKTDLGIDISENRLYKVLGQEPIFLMHQRKFQKVLRRQTITHSYGQLLQADCAYMVPDSQTGQKFFLLVIDVYSGKVFVEILDNLQGLEVAAKFKKIVKDFGSTIYELQVDAGSEFKSKYFKALLKEKNIYLRIKRPPHKASYAEKAIFWVKKKLYVYMRSSLTHNWISAVQKVVTGLNETPQKRLGFLRPNDITDEGSSVLVDKALRKQNLPVLKEPTYEEQIQSEKDYNLLSQKNEKLLKKDDFCYLDFKSSGVFDKGYDILVRI